VSVLIFRSLASSSRGNAYIIGDGETNLLLECGLPQGKLARLTRQSGVPLPRITACLITHEHKDHACCASDLLASGVPVYASEGTARALQLLDMDIIEPGDVLRFGALRVHTFPVWHDVRQPIGFLIDDDRTGERLFFAIDTGLLKYIVESVTYIAVECNYEEAVLAASQLPETLKSRIQHTHMEISDAIRFLEKQDMSGAQNIYLLHASNRHSRAAVWKRWLQERFPQVTVEICEQ